MIPIIEYNAYHTKGMERNMLKSIQQNIHRNTTDFTKCNFWMGGLDVTHKNIDNISPRSSYYGSGSVKENKSLAMGAKKNSSPSRP